MSTLRILKIPLRTLRSRGKTRSLRGAILPNVSAFFLPNKSITKTLRVIRSSDLEGKAFKRSIQRFEETWGAFTGVLATIRPGFVKGFPNRPSNRIVFEGLGIFWTKLVRMWFSQGEHFALRRVKSLCENARFTSVEATNERPITPAGTPGLCRSGEYRFSKWSRGFLREYFSENSPEFPWTPRKRYGLFQLSLWKRSLPKGDDYLKSLVMSKFRDLVSESRNSSQALKDVAADWAETFIQRYTKGSPDTFLKKNYEKLQFAISTAASRGFPRGDGGKVEADRELIALYKDHPVDHPGGVYYDAFGYRGPDLEEGVYPLWRFYRDVEGSEEEAHQGILRAAVFDVLTSKGLYPAPFIPGINSRDPNWALRSYPLNMDWKSFDWNAHIKPEVLKARAVGVAERGYKVRVVTVADATVTHALHLLRQLLQPYFENHPGISAWAGDGAWGKGIEKFLRRRPWTGPQRGLEILSVDLTSATDTFRKDLCAALLEGATRHLKKGAFLVWQLTGLATRDLLVSFSESLGLEPVSMVRGIPMGNPVSWLVLNLYTQFAWEISRVETLDVPEDELAERFRTIRGAWVPYHDQTTSRCGDDQISLGSSKRLDAFQRTIEKFDAIIGIGSNLRSPHTGVFTESLLKLYKGVYNPPSWQRNLVAKRGSKVWKCTWVDIVRIKALVRPEDRRLNSSNFWELCENPIWSTGSAVAGALSWWGSSTSTYKETSLWAHWYHHEFIAQARRLDIPVHLPLSLGGLGFPIPEDGASKSIFRGLSGKWKRALQVMLRDDRNPLNFLEEESLGAAQSATSYGTLGRKVQEILTEILTELPKDNFSDPKTLAELAGVDPPVFGQPWTLRGFKSKVPGWIPIGDFIAELRGVIMSSKGRCEEMKKGRVPGLWRVSKKLRKTLNSLLARDPGHYPHAEPLQKTGKEGLKELEYVLISRKHRIMVKSSALESLVRGFSSPGLFPFL